MRDQAAEGRGVVECAAWRAGERVSRARYQISTFVVSHRVGAAGESPPLFFSEIMSVWHDVGRAPNDALFHAESIILFRAAKNFGGSLANRSLDVTIDSEVCSASCAKVLPKSGLELGNPVVNFTNKSGIKNAMWNGEWLAGLSNEEKFYLRFIRRNSMDRRRADRAFFS